MCGLFALNFLDHVFRQPTHLPFRAGSPKISFLAIGRANGFQSRIGSLSILKQRNLAWLAHPDPTGRVPVRIRLEDAPVRRIGSAPANMIRPYFERQKWALLRAPRGRQLVLADTCISTLLDEKLPDVVDFGGSNPRVEFLMPVSPTLALMTRPELMVDATWDLTIDEIDAVNLRTYHAADRWVFSESEASLNTLLTQTDESIPPIIRP